ncbi:MAG: folate family ECF transporter S component, partial [Bacilli bacterium]
MNVHCEECLWNHPFSKTYWQDAFKGLKDIKKLVLASIMISMMIVVNIYGTALNIEVLGSKVYFEFIPAAICSMLMGPVIGMMAGAISDILGFMFLSGGYPFFFGYTLSAMMASFVYALFLYKTRITIVKILVAKLIVNIVINVLMGSLWKAIMFNSIPLYWHYVGLSVI